MRVHSTWASGASAIGVPGCPELAFWTASIARPRIDVDPALVRARSMSVVAVAPLLACGRSRRSSRVSLGAAVTAVLGGHPGQNSARLAVKPWRKLRPPTGPISPAQNTPGDRERAEHAGRPRRRRGRARRTGGGRGRCTVKSERGRGLVAGEQLAQVLVGGGRRRARGTGWSGRPRRRRRRRRRPVAWSAPSTLRTRKSPRPKSAWCSSTTTPRCSPARSERAVLLARLRSRSPRRRSRAGLPPELLDPVALGHASPRSGCPIGRQPWDTTVRTVDPVEEHADRAASDATRPSSTSRLPPGPRAADARPPITCERRDGPR